MNLYSPRGQAARGLVPWSHVLTLSQAGDNLAKLAALYNKRPETSISGALSIPTLMDGPVQMAVWDKDVTLNGATITASNKCRGLFCVFTGNLTVTGSASKIHMDGMGSTGVDWAAKSLGIPSTLEMSSSSMTQDAVLALIRSSGRYVGDPQFWADLSPLVTGTLSYDTGLIADPALCGAAGAVGGAGGAGSRGTGGGSGGSTTRGSAGVWWRGGFGAGSNQSGGDYRVGSPAGIVVVAVLGALTVGPGFTVSANGAVATNGGAGGGRSLLLTGGTVTGSPTVQANGAASGGTASAAGGVGTATASTLAAWGL